MQRGYFWCKGSLGACVLRVVTLFVFFFSSRRRHTRLVSDWSSDVCSSDLAYSRLRPLIEIEFGAVIENTHLINVSIAGGTAAGDQRAATCFSKVGNSVDAVYVSKIGPFYTG